MKKLFKTQILLLALLGLASGGLFTAQGQVAPARSLQKVKEPMQWTIRFSYPEDLPPQTPADVPKTAPVASRPYLDKRPRKIVISMANRLVHEQIVDSDGLVSDRWQTGQTQYMKVGVDAWTQHEPGSNGSSGDSGYSPLPSSGFRDLEWVSDSTYAGTTVFGDVNCLVFIPGGNVQLEEKPDKLKAQLDAAPVIVFLDATTRYPFYHRINGEIRRYEFTGSAPSGMTFPSDLTAAIKQGEEARARLNQSASKPY